MGHPSYSPNLARNDFSVFPHIKKKCVVNDFRHQEILLECSKSSFGGVSIEVEKQTHMMLVHQNILSTVMLKNVKLSYGNVRLHLAIPEICQARNCVVTHVILVQLQIINFIFQITKLQAYWQLRERFVFYGPVILFPLGDYRIEYKENKDQYILFSYNLFNKCSVVLVQAECM